jgi:hypothetical protein
MGLGHLEHFLLAACFHSARTPGNCGCAFAFIQHGPRFLHGTAEQRLPKHQSRDRARPGASASKLVN